MTRTRTGRRPSANGQGSRTGDIRNRWASEATPGSRDMPRRSGTTTVDPHSWVDNRALLED